MPFMSYRKWVKLWDIIISDKFLPKDCGYIRDWKLWNDNHCELSGSLYDLSMRYFLAISACPAPFVSKF